MDPWSRTGLPNTPFDQEFYLILDVAVGGTNGYFEDGIGEPLLVLLRFIPFLCAIVASLMAPLQEINPGPMLATRRPISTQVSSTPFSSDGGSSDPGNSNFSCCPRNGANSEE